MVEALAGFWIGNLIHQAWAFPPGLMAPRKRGIEAQHFQGPLHAVGFFQLLNPAVQGACKFGGTQGCCALAPPLFLQPSCPLV